MKKLISMLMLVTMLLAMLVACGGGDTTDNTSGGPSNDDGGEYLEAVDFEGYTFRVLQCEGYGSINSLQNEEADETSIMYQAQVERDSEIMDKFNIVIDDTYSGNTNGITTFVIKDALNPVASFDVGCIAGGKEQATEIVTMNLAEDAAKMPIMDLTKEWYVQQANAEYNLYGKQFFFAGAYPSLPGSPNFYFNKDFITGLNMDLPYDMILEGNWTIEELMKYTTVGYSNFNSADGNIDGLDKFGYAGHDRSICYFYQGFGGPTTARTTDGGLVPVLSNDTVVAMYDKIREFYDDKANWTNKSLDAGDATSSHRVFYDGRAMFCYWITGTLRAEDIETFTKGLAILPKYNLDQENYCCPVAGGTKVFPRNLEDSYTTGYIYEALCEATWRIVYPASIQEARDFETLSDDESIAIKKLIDQSLTYDILKECDPTGGKLGSCGFIAECVDTNSEPAIVAMMYGDIYDTMFEEFCDGILANINK